MKKVKVLSVILCMCLAVSLFASCDKETASGGEGAPIRIVVSPTNRPDCALVSQELSKITQEKFGFDVEFMFGYDSQKLTLTLASNEAIDIGYDGGLAYIDRVHQNAYVDITDMVKEKTPTLYEAIPEELWVGTQVDGKNYAVPSYKEMAEIWTALVDKKIIDESGVDVSTIKEIKDLEPILKTLKKYPERAGLEVLTTSINHLSAVMRSKYDIVKDYFVVERANPDKILHFMETEEYKEFVYLMRDWYKKGYIAQDVATKTDMYTTQRNSGNMGIKILWYYPTAEVTLKDSYHVDALVPIHLSPAIKSNDSMFGNLYGIYNKSKNVDNALKFLELWNTDPAVKNMITYGIEGKHYEMVDGRVRRKEGALDLYRLDNSISGNMMISALLENDPADKWEQFKAFNEGAVTSKTLGFFADSANVSGQLGACTNVVAEYNPLLSCGVVDPDKYLEKMLTALEKSGVNEIKAEFQRQYDAWRK